VSVAPESQDSVASLYARYGYYVLRRCTVLLRNRAAAEDVLQEVFMRVMRSRTELSAVERPLAWLYRIADNACLDVIRHDKVAAVSGEAIEDRVGPHPGVQLEHRSIVLRLLRTLDERDQRICILAFIDGMTQEEIAAELALSRVTINKRVQQIRAQADRLFSSASTQVQA
jgi:RNA polymerase sigma-70 factor (ECF subfamily)